MKLNFNFTEGVSMRSFRGNKGVSLVEILVVLVIIMILGSLGFTKFYGYAHAKTVTGVVESINNLTPVGVRGSTDGTVKYSFAVSVAVEGSDEIFTFSAEDRQWGTVKSGDKVKVTAYPYAPWDLGKAGTYNGGRLIQRYKN